MPPYSLYLHIPFCKHRCAYCDFNTYAGLDGLMDDYIQALCRELVQAAEAAGNRLPVHTIFFGGGTPSLVPLAGLEEILETIEKHYALETEAEITLEANPGTVTKDGLKGMHQAGINRLSMGMQSASTEELHLLERSHTYYDVIQAVTWARQAGFDNLNLDLMFGLPHQRLESWQQSIQLALGLGPDHLSIYSLILEHGTPMNSWVERGLMPEPDEDAAADMYEWVMEFLGTKGYVQYEISNWARRDAQGEVGVCRHNLQYWRNQPYLGLGAGAHGYAAGTRTANVLGPAQYIQRCMSGAQKPFPLTPATVNAHPVDMRTAMMETMMVGMRLTQEGVPDARFRGRFGIGIADAFPEEVVRLLQRGLVAWVDGALRLTRLGTMLGNQVFMEFV